MPGALRDDFIGLDEYERLCEEAEEGERLEYIDGQVIRMMVGGSTAHHALTRRLDNLIAERLAPGGPCTSFRETMRLQAGTARFYPDVFVSCGESKEADAETKSIRSATVILEVLSPSTEQYDRGRKWLKYQALPELMHFALVAQDQRRVEAFHRDGAGWRYELLQQPEDVLRLKAIGVELRLDELYSVVPLLAMDSSVPTASVTFAPDQVLVIAAMKGLPSSADIDAMVAEMDADECEVAVGAIIRLLGTPAIEEWKSVLPDRLKDRLDSALSSTTYG